MLADFELTIIGAETRLLELKQTDQFQYLQLAQNMKKLIIELDKNHPKESTRRLINQVLYRSQTAIYEPTNQPNLNQLTELAKTLTVQPSKKAKFLGFLLYAFAAVLIVGGILALIPTSGGSALLSFLVMVKLHSFAAVIASSANSAAAAIGHGVSATAVTGVVGMGSGALVWLATRSQGLFKSTGCGQAITDFSSQIKKEKPPAPKR